MLLSLQSIEDKNSTESPKTYSRIRTNINIPWECNYIKYHVSSLNTKANILITTKEDMIKVVDSDGEKYEFNFEDQYYMYESQLEFFFKPITIFDKVQIVNRHLKIHSSKDFKFTILSHRARLVTGLLNVKLNEMYKAGDHTFDIPILDYANKLYLVSKQGQSIQSNIGDQEYTPSIIGNVDAFIKDGSPLFVNFDSMTKPIENVVNIDSFKMIELELVDFMYQPIVLRSPMFVTMRVDPYKVPHVDYEHM